MRLLLILVFGTLLGGLVLAGMASLDRFDLEPSEAVTPEAPAEPAHRPVRQAAAARRPRSRFADPFVEVLQRRLRREFVMAHAYAEEPSVESLWA